MRREPPIDTSSATALQMRRAHMAKKIVAFNIARIFRYQRGKPRSERRVTRYRRVCEAKKVMN
jgi:hypothetical protein